MPTTRGALPTSKPKNSSARAPESGFDCAISPAQTGDLGDNMWIVPAMAMVALLSGLSGAARAADAFPGAEGFGRRAQGGRGGAIIKVKNLNDSGPGSIRACIDAPRPRQSVFRGAVVILFVTDP